MASVPTAAFDPIFWVHHANIDRLWTRWACLPGRSWGTLPDAAWLGEQPWHFNDVDGQVRSEARRTWLTLTGLGYTYQDSTPGCVPLALPPPSPVAVAAPARQPSPTREIARSAAGFSAGLGRPARVELAAAVARGPKALATPTRAKAIEVSGIVADGTPNAVYEVYVNLPAGAAVTRRAPAFVGTIGLFGIEHAHRHSGHDAGSRQLLDISRAVRANPNGGAVTVEIRPFPLLVPRRGGPRDPAAAAAATPFRQREASVRFGAIRLLAD